MDDIESAVRSAAAAGCVIAVALTDIPGEGRIAISVQGWIRHGLWQR